MTLPSTNARRWRRYHVDLPVHVVALSGPQRLVVQGQGTELSRGGMALYAALTLKPGDPIEVEFQTPSKLKVVGIVRNRTGFCFGLEFLTPLPS